MPKRLTTKAKLKILISLSIQANHCPSNYEFPCSNCPIDAECTNHWANGPYLDYDHEFIWRRDCATKRLYDLEFTEQLKKELRRTGENE